MRALLPSVWPGKVEANKLSYFCVETFYTCRQRMEIVWLPNPPLLNPPDGGSVIQSWEETDGHRPESQTPAGWYDGGWGGVGQTQRVGRTEGGRNFLWSAGSLGSCGTPSLTLPAAHLPPQNWKWLLNCFCFSCLSVPYFVHAWVTSAVPSFFLLSVTTGCCLSVAPSCLIRLPLPFISLPQTPQDVITLADVSLMTNQHKKVPHLQR